MAATENATAILQKSCTTAANAAATLNLKIIQASHTNSDAAWDFAQKLFTVKSLAEFTALSTAHVRKQCEVWSEQAKEFSALTQKLTIETVEPVKNGVTKMLKAA